MRRLDYKTDVPSTKTIGLIVLQSDETIEQEFRRFLPTDIQFHVSRIPSGKDVTTDSLQAMEARLPEAASLFPEGLRFDVIGYGCTSGTAQIGAAKIAELIKGAANTKAVTEPVSALVQACRTLQLSKLAFLSPYIGDVSKQLRAVLADAGIQTPVFGSFEEAEERQVARISQHSTHTAGLALAQAYDVDGLFLSCTNLRSFDIMAPLEAELRRPVLSSNQVLLWHMLQLSGVSLETRALGQLFGKVQKSSTST